MKVLVVGSGGREHALAWRLIQGTSVDEVVMAPGNAGTAKEIGVRNEPIAVDDFDALVAFAQREEIDLTVVGPEGPLVAGICDRFASAGLDCFGPSASAAQLEGSKAFAKDFLARHNIPTGRYETFAEVDAALAYVRKQGAPIVIKADGLKALLSRMSLKPQKQQLPICSVAMPLVMPGRGWLLKNFFRVKKQASSVCAMALAQYLLQVRRITKRVMMETADQIPVVWGPTLRHLL